MSPPSQGRNAATLIRSLRAVTGLYLLTYVTLHLLNLCIGLVSLDAMEAARPYLSGIMTGRALMWVLMLAMLVHYLLGLWSIYRRPSLTGTPQDVVQALSGLVIIPLLATHALGVGGLKDAGVEVTYEMVNRVFWLSNPAIGLTQVLLISIVWVHGCAGLFMGLRARPGALRMLPWLYPLAVAVPVLALLGYTQAGRLALIEGLEPVSSQTTGAYGDQGTPGGYGYGAQSAPAPAPAANSYGYGNQPAPAPAPNAYDYSYGAQPDSPPGANGGPPASTSVPFATIAAMTSGTIWISISLGVLVLAARILRRWIASPAPVMITTRHAGQITGHTGQTLLDAFRAQNQPHANLCAGRGRCGTCAVRLLNSDTALPPATPLEQATLDRLEHGSDIRLACQLPLEQGSTLEVERLLPPDYTFEHDEAARLRPAKIPA